MDSKKSKEKLLREMRVIRAYVSEPERRPLTDDEGFSQLLDIMPEGFALHEIICDEKGNPSDYRFLEVNPAFERLTKHKRTDVVGKTVREVFPHIEDFWIKTYGKVALTRQPVSFENYSSDLNRFYEVFAYSPAPGQFAALFRDITDRKRMEEDLQEAKRNYEDLFHNTSVGIAHCRVIGGDKGKPADLVFLEVNDMFETVSGLKKETVLGKRITEVFPGFPNSMLERLGLLALTGKGDRFEYYERNLDRWFDIRVHSPGQGRLISIISNITDRKKAEETLRESQRNLAAGERIGKMGSWQWNLETDEAHWSEELYRIYDVEPGTAAPSLRDLSNIIHPDDRGFVITEAEELKKTGRPYRIDYRIITRSGETRWIHSEGSATAFSQSGEPLCLAGIVRDVSDRKKFELALEESEARLRATIESFPFDFFVLDMSGRYVMQNTTCLKRWGNIIGKRPEDLGVAEETLAVWKNNNERAYRGETVEGEIRFKIGSEEGFYYNILTPILEHGEIRGILGVNIDITKRKVAEEALLAARNEAEKEKRRLEAVMEALPVGMAIIDERGGIVTSNSAFQKLWGGERGIRLPPTRSVSDYGVFQAWWPDTGIPVDVHEWGAARAVEKGESAVGQLLEIMRMDGTTAFVINSAAPVRDPDGTIRGAAVAIQDITELRRAQDALREGEARYRQLARSLKKTVRQQVGQLRETEHLAAMGRMVSIVAHEVRNPLLNILLGANMLRDTVGKDKQTLEILDEISYGVNRLSDTVNEMLDYARAVRLERAVCQIGDIVRKSLQALPEKPADIKVTVDLENEKRELLVDNQKIEQSLVNILRNAIESMPAGGALNIRSRLSGSRRITLLISDSGEGMNRDVLEKLFEPFYTTKATGAGLGLAISKKFIETHGGKISIRSRLHKGTTVKITLPLAA